MYKFLLALLLLIFVGCSNDSSGPTAESILEENPSADIIQYNGQVYSNLTEQHEDQDFDKVEFLGEIENQTNNPSEFDNLSGSMLEEGTELYSTNEEDEILLIIASTSEGDKFYRILLEG